MAKRNGDEDGNIWIQGVASWKHQETPAHNHVRWRGVGGLLYAQRRGEKAVSVDRVKQTLCINIRRKN